MKQDELLDDQVVRMRREFDDSFGRLPCTNQVALEDFLLLSTAATCYAVPLRDVALLQGQVRVTPVPSPNTVWRGLCGVRGELLAVFDLGVCLGHPQSASACTWVIRAAGTTAAFAFERFEGHVRAASPSQSDQPSILVNDGRWVPVVKLASLVSACAPSLQPFVAQKREPNHV